MSSCRRAKRLIEVLADGPLDPTQSALLYDHTAQCKACAAAQSVAETLEHTLLAIDETPRLPGSRLSEIRAAVLAQALEQAEPVATRSRPWILPLMAAGLAGLVWGALLLQRSKPEEADSQESLVEVDDSAPRRGLPEIEPESHASKAPHAVPLLPESPLFAESWPTTSGVWITLDEGVDLRRKQASEAIAALLQDELPSDFETGAFVERAQALVGAAPAWLRALESIARDQPEAHSPAVYRVLGLHGDRVTAQWLRPAYGLDESLALVVLWQRSIPRAEERLARAVGDGVIEPALILLHAARGPSASSDLALHSLQLARTGSGRGSLATAWAALEGPDFALLPALRVARLVSSSDLHAALQASPLTRSYLEEAAAWEAAGVDPELLQESIAQLGVVAALPWVSGRARRSSTRDSALTCLAEFQGPAGLGALMELRPLMSTQDLEDSLRTTLNHNAGYALQWAEGVVLAGQVGPATALVEELVGLDSPEVVGPLLSVLSMDGLSADDKLMALDTISTLGEPRDAAALTLYLTSLTTDRRRIAAACTLAIHRLAGESASRQALESLPHAAQHATRIKRLLGRLQREVRTTRGASIVRLSRDLEFLLPQPAGASAQPESL